MYAKIIYNIGGIDMSAMDNIEGIRQKERAINIPKETGLFISTKI